MEKYLSHFDTSSYPVDPRILHSKANAKGRRQVQRRVRRSGCARVRRASGEKYSLHISRHDKKLKMTDKGVKRGYVKKHVWH